MELDKVTIKGESFVLVPTEMFYELMEDTRDLAYINANAANLQETIPGEIVHRIFLHNENPIKVYRQYQQITQEDFANKIGSTLQHLQNIENNHTIPKKSELVKIAQILNVAVDEIS